MYLCNICVAKKKKKKQGFTHIHYKVYRHQVNSKTGFITKQRN